MEPQVIYSIKKRINTVLRSFFFTKSIVDTLRQFRREFSEKKAPTRPIICRVFDKFRDTKTVEENYFGLNDTTKSARTENHVELVRRRL